MHILLYILNVSSCLCSFLFQSLWLCHSGHVFPQYAHPCSSTDALWLCDHCQNMSRTCGGDGLYCIYINEMFLFISNIYHSAISSLSCRGCHIQPVMVFGQNGHHLLKEVAWPRQPFVVSPLSLCWFLSVIKQ